MIKYVLWTDHKAGFYKENMMMSLKAQNLLDAIKESEDFCKYDENLSSVWLYERVAKNEYRQIMRSNDGISFHAEEDVCYLIRSTYKIKGETFESFETRF